MWRICPDAAASQLAIEVRDGDLLLNRFYVFDTHCYTLTELKLNMKHAWWQGLEDSYKGVVYLHGIGDHKTGQHKGITARVTTVNSVLWEQPELTWYGITDNGVLAYAANAQEAGLVRVDAQTGATLETGISQQEAALRVTAFTTQQQACTYPDLYREGETYFAQVRDFLEATAGVKPVQALEYAEVGTLIIISYYEASVEGELDNYLVGYNLEGDLCLKVLLGEGLSGIGSDTFFIFRHDLYFIRDKNTLQAYTLLSST